MRAICPDLSCVQEEPERDHTFLRALARWAARYTPWVAVEKGDGLVLDLTGSAHLFGGEAPLLDQIISRLNDRGLTVRAGLADTRGAAWALARFGLGAQIAPEGRTREAVASLPVAALRIDEDITAGLNRLGLHRVGDIAVMQRGALARRFGAIVVKRLDQMFGVEPEPVAPSLPVSPYAVRLLLPEPIGKTDDVIEALNRLLMRLCQRLERDQRGARHMRLSIQRTDHSEETIEIGLARPSREPKQITRLFEHGINGMDAGFGIDAVRLHAFVTEPLQPEQNVSFNQGVRDKDALEDLIARIGNRIGFERVTRYLPAESHIPERAFTVAAAAYSKPEPFSKGERDRPVDLFSPEPVVTISAGKPPADFRWRGVAFETQHAIGPERIAPEWWWDDPNWRSGVRDYWKVQTTEGRRLWLFHAKGGETAAGWFAHGEFA